MVTDASTYCGQELYMTAVTVGYAAFPFPINVL